MARGAHLVGGRWAAHGRVCRTVSPSLLPAITQSKQQPHFLLNLGAGDISGGCAQLWDHPTFLQEDEDEDERVPSQGRARPPTPQGSSIPLCARRDSYSQFVPEGVLANTVGLLLVAFGLVVGYVLTRDEWKRPPLAEELALSMDFKTLTEGESPGGSQ